MSSILSLMSFPIVTALQSLYEIDEVSQEKLPDGRLRVTFITTGVHPTLTKVKTWIWAIFGLPVQRVDEYNVEELQRGTVLKRYKITVVLSPIGLGATRRF